VVPAPLRSLLACILLSGVLGTVHAWSLFIEPYEEELGRRWGARVDLSGLLSENPGCGSGPAGTRLVDGPGAIDPEVLT
jgi:hypothetical protein